MKKIISLFIIVLIIFNTTSTYSQDLNIEKHRHEIYSVISEYMDLTKTERKRLTEMLLFCAAVESDFDKKKSNKWFQIQKTTEKYILNKLDNKEDLIKLKKNNKHHYYIVVAGEFWKYHLNKNKIKLPKRGEFYAQAILWKKIYNTHKGKGTVRGAYVKAKKYLS